MDKRLHFLTPTSLMVYLFLLFGGGWVVRWCWVNFQCRGVLVIRLIVGQGPTALAVGAGGGCLDIFILIYLFFPLSPSLRATARYRLKYCLKGPINPKQPTNQIVPSFTIFTLRNNFHDFIFASLLNKALMLNKALPNVRKELTGLSSKSLPLRGERPKR